VSAGERESIPVRQDVLGFLNLLRRTGKIEPHFSGSASDFNLDGFQAAVLHSQAELFLNFFDPVLLEAIRHDEASPGGGHKAIAKARHPRAGAHLNF
jgi:hypothetical protein